MKFAVALCFLAAFRTIDANPTSIDLESLRLQVRNAKWNAENIIRQLQLLRNEAEEDTILKVTEKWDEEQDSHRLYKTLLLNEIKKEVNAARLAGKNVDLCYDEALKGIEESEDAASTDAQKCIDTAQNSIQNNLGFIDNLILTGNELLSELDGIFLECHDSDIFKMQSCIVAELARINAAIRALGSDTNSAEITIVHVSNNIVLQATNCLKKAYSPIYSAGITIKMRLGQCIETELTTTEATIKATTDKSKSKILKKSLYFQL